MLSSYADTLGTKQRVLGRSGGAFDFSIDSFVFIDEQPFERAEVVSVHPEARVLEPSDLGALNAHPWFDVAASAESGMRRQLYPAEAGRMDALERGGDDYMAILWSAGLQLSVQPLPRVDVERAFELSQRTNQLHITGMEYGREVLQRLTVGGGGCFAFTLRRADRFTDDGLMGLVVLELRFGAIHELFLSCRAQRNRVESALFSGLNGVAGVQGCQRRSVAPVLTLRYRAATDMLETLCFIPVDPERCLWVRAVGKGAYAANFVSVATPGLAPAAEGVVL